MKRLYLAITTLFALTLIGGGAGAGEWQKIRIGTEGAYPPFNYIDKAGQLQGFDIDIARALCAKMQVECSLVAQDWDGIIPGLLARKYDAIIASMSITPERKRRVAFTDPYYSNTLAFIAKKGSGFKTDKASLKGKFIGAQRATVSSQYAEDNLSGVIKLKLYDTQEAAYLDLTSGRLDAVLADKLPSYNWLQSDAGKAFEFVGDPIDIGDKIGIAIRKRNQDLAQMFNKALAAILEDGTYQKINAKYFPFDIY